MNFDTKIDNSGFKAGVSEIKGGSLQVSKDISEMSKKMNDEVKNGSRSMSSAAATLAAEYKKSGASSSEAYKKAWQEIERQSEKSSANVANDISGIDDAAENTAAAMNGKMSASFASFSRVAVVAVAAVGAAFAGAATAAIAVGSSFEEGMDKVSAISGATAADMERLTAKAEEMGAKTKFTATESAEALQYMAQAGWKTSQMLDGIDGVMSLAAASGESLASVSDIVTDALTAFGLQAADCAHFSDVLAMAASASNTDVAKMGATFKYVAPLAGAMKYSIEDTAVAIGLMANAGIKGEMAGTSLRQMFTRLANPPKDAAEALDALKISITNADGSIKPLSTTLLDLREKFSGLSDSEKAQKAASIAGQEAMSGLLAIVNASASDFENLTAQINNADGSAEEMAATMQDNLKGQLTILGSSLEAVGIAAYGKFQEPMKTAVQSAIGGLNNLTSSLKSGRLSESVDKIANSFAYCAAEAASFVTEKALPTLIDGFAWFADNGRSVATVIGVVGGAIGGYTIATNIATIATKLFTGAFVVSPIGLLRERLQR